jgi:hypothetical protein
MKTLTNCVLALLCLLFIVSCQKEYSFEQGQPSRGSLRSDVTFDCLPKTINGTYRAGSALGDTNFIEVEVNVLQTGTYNIFTDTVNGYFFKGTGTFSATGANKVKLLGSGTPGVAGDDDFIVYYDTTLCFVSVTVLPPAVTGPAAAFTLGGAGGNCSNPQFAGTFAKGTALNSSNKVTLEVTVTTPGTYNVSTTSVNGMQFSGTGTLTGTGAQTIVLTGSGTPTNEGNFNFTVTAGATTCTFPVTVTNTPPATTNNHFPLSANSWWSYNDPESPGDTIKIVNNNVATFGGNQYRVFESQYEDGSSFESYYRKSGNDYFEYIEADNYSLLVTFDAPVKADILFLKENLTAGATWTSAEYSGAVSGTPVKLRYVFTCTAINATETVGGKTFTGVYKITFKPQISAGGAPFVDEGSVWEAWYANNIGVINMSVGDGTTTIFTTDIRYWNVL